MSMLLLTAARKATASATVAGGAQVGVPKLMHFTYDGELSDEQSNLLQQWVNHNPTWKLRVHDSNARRAFVEDRFPEYLMNYDGLLVPVERADFFRLLILLGEGGAYFDLDTAPVAQLNGTFEGLGRPLVLGWEKEVGPEECSARQYAVRRQIATWAMASAPGHPVMRKVVERVARLWNVTFQPRNFRRNVLLKTGPASVTQAVLQALEDGWKPQAGDSREHWSLLVLPQSSWGNKEIEAVNEAPMRLAQHMFAGSWKGDPFGDPAVRQRLDPEAPFGDCEAQPSPFTPLTLQWVRMQLHHDASASAVHSAHGAGGASHPRNGSTHLPGTARRSSRRSGTGGNNASGARRTVHRTLLMQQVQGTSSAEATSSTSSSAGSQGIASTSSNATRQSAGSSSSSTFKGAGATQQLWHHPTLFLPNRDQAPPGEEASEVDFLGRFGNVPVGGLQATARPTAAEVLAALAVTAASSAPWAAPEIGSRNSSRGGAGAKDTTGKVLTGGALQAADLGATYGLYTMALAAAGLNVTAINTEGLAAGALEQAIHFNSLTNRVRQLQLPASIDAGMAAANREHEWTPHAEAVVEQLEGPFVVARVGGSGWQQQLLMQVLLRAQEEASNQSAAHGRLPAAVMVSLTAEGHGRPHKATLLDALRSLLLTAQGHGWRNQAKLLDALRSMGYDHALQASLGTCTSKKHWVPPKPVFGDGGLVDSISSGGQVASWCVIDASKVTSPDVIFLSRDLVSSPVFQAGLVCHGSACAAHGVHTTTRGVSRLWAFWRSILVRMASRRLPDSS